jgi:drug/metabolite transporter (DMT)-like permease
MRAEAVLFGANMVYATSYVATRLTLDHVPPATLAFIRCALAGALLLPFAVRALTATRITCADQARIAGMGMLGFGAAFALAHWGLLRSTAANGSLLIIVEPLAIMALSPLMLGERLRRHEVAVLLGDAVTVYTGVGAVLIVAGLVLTAKSSLAR